MNLSQIIISVIMLLFVSTSANADARGSMFSQEIRLEAQLALNYYGFDVGTPDGAFGPQTQSAIRLYQAANNMSQSGEFSRATMGLLLEKYRKDIANVQAQTQSGLPSVVTAELAEMGSFCETPLNVLENKLGVIQAVDLNNDGRMDYIIDGSAMECFSVCGAANCQVTVFASSGASYRRNEFLGYSVTPNTFSCSTDGKCGFR